MKTTIPSVKGTRDFYPEDMMLRSWIYRTVRQVSESFGYQEYEGPIIEKIDLYAAKSGEELVKEQAFVFEDRGGDLITLRPELTPTVARMVAQKQRELIIPLRWWSFGPFWRYEKPQKGRTREFFQWNIDLFGADTPEADAELIAICVEFFKKVGLSSKQVHVYVNNRRLMDSELAAIGITPEKKSSVFRLIDRRDKMQPSEWEAFALDAGITSEQLNALKEMLENPALWERSDEMRRFFSVIDGMGIRDYVEFDPQVIRGLDYYTGTVFEARDEDGGRAILGGGRYDNLLNDVGGDPLPGVGFAMGDVMISVLLKKYGLLPETHSIPVNVMITIFNEQLIVDSNVLSAELRGAGIKNACYPEASKLQKQLRYADRIGIRFVLIMGPDELSEGQVTVKDLVQHSQETVKRTELVKYLSERLA